MYSDQFKAVVLGALFHDIGKFFQRADENISYKKSVLLSSNTKRNINQICPNPSSGYSHKHALWTYEFFLRNKENFRSNFLNEEDLGQNKLIYLAGYHHNPSTELQVLIQQADWYSSGMDRTKTDEELLQSEEGKYNFRFTRLRPIFEEIELDKHTPKQEYKYEIRPLTMERKELFPKKITELHLEAGEDLWKDYQSLWNQFENKFGKIKAKNFYFLVDSYLSLLEKYTWCIPSSTNDMPDISLFDHLKTTAAIASCLYRFHENDQLTKDAIKNRNQEKFLLVGGDLSGIQKYIFDLTHVNLRKVSKTLRARSFYLSALPKVLVTKILAENDLTACNCLMESGGRFILLMPNTEKVNHYLETLQRDLSEWCMNEFYGELMVVLDWSVSLCGNDFFQDENNKSLFTPKIDELNQSLEVKKLQKYLYKSEVDWEDNGFVIGLDYEKLKDDTTELCRTCGKKPASKPITDEEGETIQICDACYRQQKIGKELTHRAVFSIEKLTREEADKINKPGFHFNFGVLDNDKSVYSLILHHEDDLKFLTKPTLITAFALDKAETFEYLPRHHVANYVPRFGEEEVEKYKKLYKPEEAEHIQKDAIKTFNDLAIPPNQLENPDDKSGTPYLAIIKADVDNLGLIFSQGIKKRFSISRYATLSRMMNTFFCGYLNTFLQERFPNIYTVYAGGDDLFLIGNWQDIIHFAPEFYNEFKLYTCQNEDLHLTAAIELVKRRSPVRKGAEQAEEALDHAKSKIHTKSDCSEKIDIEKAEILTPPKNSLSLFNTVFSWEEWDWLNEWIEFFDEKLKENKSEEGKTKINSAFLYRLLRYQQMAMDYCKNRKIDGLLYLSQLSYDIARNIRADNNLDLTRELSYLQRLGQINKPEERKIIEHIHIPIFYALYKHRGGR